jgi:N-acetylmuramoyl-L-alanine amidase
MNAILLSVLKIVLASGLLYGYYCAFLRNKKFHRYNRFYLLGATFFSFLLPFLNIPIDLFGSHTNDAALLKTLRAITISQWEEPVTVYPPHTGWLSALSWQNGLLFIYSAGCLAGLVMIAKSLIYIRSIRRKYPAKLIAATRFYNTGEPGTPFSFFRSIFWNNQLDFNTKTGQQVFRHEWFHVQEKHSADVLLLQAASSICWFNPFFHLINRELKAIHEFLADEYAVSGNNHYEYAELLVARAIEQKNNRLTHAFFHHPIKRRIAMITQHYHTRRGGWLGRVMVLPLLFTLFCAFALKINSRSTGFSLLPATPVKVIIDAGHGGIDPGAKSSSGISEKDITLAIARKINELSGEYQVQVTLTRSGDALPGGAQTVGDGLKNRVAQVNTLGPDAFISLHVNASGEASTTESGFEAYIASRRKEAKDAALASALLDQLQSLYPTAQTIKQRKEQGIFVLDNNTCPAVLIQCGYINNNKDLRFVMEPANQEKIARKILEGIKQYALNKQAGNGGLAMAQQDTLPADAFGKIKRDR